jgi:hypothetical protein
VKRTCVLAVVFKVLSQVHAHLLSHRTKPSPKRLGAVDRNQNGGRRAFAV